MIATFYVEYLTCLGDYKHQKVCIDVTQIPGIESVAQSLIPLYLWDYALKIALKPADWHLALRELRLDDVEVELDV